MQMCSSQIWHCGIRSLLPDTLLIYKHICHSNVCRKVPKLYHSMYDSHCHCSTYTPGTRPDAWWTWGLCRTPCCIHTGAGKGLCLCQHSGLPWICCYQMPCWWLVCCLHTVSMCRDRRNHITVKGLAQAGCNTSAFSKLGVQQMCCQP